jgi:hypothetical protein
VVEYVYLKHVARFGSGGGYSLDGRNVRCITKTCIFRLHINCLLLSVSSNFFFSS